MEKQEMASKLGSEQIRQVSAEEWPAALAVVPQSNPHA
jgi:hypothetical protein